MVERRSIPRVRSLVGATILLPGGGVIDCFLQNWSRVGARLLVSGTTNIGDRFALEGGPLGRRREAKVIWSSPTELGVTFRTSAQARG